MKIKVTKHALARYRERIRDCSDKQARMQIEAAYALSRHESTLPDGKEIHRIASITLVKCLNGYIATVY